MLTSSERWEPPTGQSFTGGNVGGVSSGKDLIQVHDLKIYKIVIKPIMKHAGILAQW